MNGGSAAPLAAPSHARPPQDIDGLPAAAPSLGELGKRSFKAVYDTINPSDPPRLIRCAGSPCARARAPWRVLPCP
jgi:hypothetical protein